MFSLETFASISASEDLISPSHEWKLRLIDSVIHGFPLNSRLLDMVEHSHILCVHLHFKVGKTGC